MTRLKDVISRLRQTLDLNINVKANINDQNSTSTSRSFADSYPVLEGHIQCCLSSSLDWCLVGIITPPCLVARRWKDNARQPASHFRFFPNKSLSPNPHLGGAQINYSVQLLAIQGARAEEANCSMTGLRKIQRGFRLGAVRVLYDPANRKVVIVWTLLWKQHDVIFTLRIYASECCFDCL